MSYIRISNDSFFDKDYESTFCYQEEYKFFNIGSSLSALVPAYKTILKEVLGNLTEQIFKDLALNKEQTKSIQTVFEREIEKELANRIPTGKFPHKIIKYKGVSYELDLRLSAPVDRTIDDYFTIIDICKECLEENKSMYLSIE